jgi:hypothetical protein
MKTTKFFDDVAALVAMLSARGAITSAEADALYIANAKQAADARALWAVRVLDAWASRDDERYVSFGPQYGGPSPGNLGGHYCSLRRNDHRDAELREGYFGTTPDAARLAAAEALVAADPSLAPDAQRATRNQIPFAGMGGTAPAGPDWGLVEDSFAGERMPVQREAPERCPCGLEIMIARTCAICFPDPDAQRGGS